MIRFPDDTIFFDIESHSVTERYGMDRYEYFRLGGYSWGESEKITITEDLDELVRQIEKARMIVGHNIHLFDLGAIYGQDSIRPLELAYEGRVFCSLAHATLAWPAPDFYTPAGASKPVMVKTPDQARKWFGLNNLAHQLGVQGKTMDLKKYAEQWEFDYTPVLKKDGTPGKRMTKTRKPDVCCGFGHIPKDDETFVEYLEYDVIASREVARGLIVKHPVNDYAVRNQKMWAIDAQITRNGILVDQEENDRRVREVEDRVATRLQWLHDRYGLPLESKAPLSTNVGKEALLTALRDVGVSTNDLLRTDSGALSFSGDSVVGAAEKADNDEARELAEVVKIIGGSRTLAQLAQDSVREDGRVHPEITGLQKSGRRSVTKPGLTIWTARGPGAVEKEYFIADPGHVLIEADLSNADARGVAAMSGDEAYAKRFEPGADGHMINAIAAWGEVVVNESDETRAYYRNRAKPLGHGWSYGGGPKGLAENTGEPVSVTQQFCDGMARAFKKVIAWQEKERQYARDHGYILGLWGRKMPVEKNRIFTQGPALKAQNWTTELIYDALLQLSLEEMRHVLLTIHDAILFCVPQDQEEHWRDRISKIMYSSRHPRGGQRIEIPATLGRSASNWYEAGHEASH